MTIHIRGADGQRADAMEVELQSISSPLLSSEVSLDGMNTCSLRVCPCTDCSHRRARANMENHGTHRLRSRCTLHFILLQIRWVPVLYLHYFPRYDQYPTPVSQSPSDLHREPNPYCACANSTWSAQAFGWCAYIYLCAGTNIPPSKNRIVKGHVKYNLRYFWWNQCYIQ